MNLADRASPVEVIFRAPAGASGLVLWVQYDGDGGGRQFTLDIPVRPHLTCYHYFPAEGSDTATEDSGCQDQSTAAIRGGLNNVFEEPPQMVSAQQDLASNLASEPQPLGGYGFVRKRLEIDGGEIEADIDYLPAGSLSGDVTNENDVPITGFSERTINARYSMMRAVRIPIVFSRFSGKASSRGAEIASYIGDALLAQGSLAPTADKPIELASGTGQREKQLARLGLLEQDALFLSGRYIERKTHFEIQAEVRSTRPGFDLLVRDHGLCPKDQLLTCSSEIAQRLLGNLLAALTDRRTEGTTRLSENVAIKPINLEPDLFPARAGAYRVPAHTNKSRLSIGLQASILTHRRPRDLITLRQQGVRKAKVSFRSIDMQNIDRARIANLCAQ